MNFFLLKFIWRIRHTEKTPVFKVGSEQNIYNRNKPIRLLLHNPMGLFLSHIQKPSANCKTAHKSTFCEKITVPKADRLRTSVLSSQWCKAPLKAYVPLRSKRARARLRWNCYLFTISQPLIAVLQLGNAPLLCKLTIIQLRIKSPPL